jgi:hypothetical protein
MTLDEKIELIGGTLTLEPTQSLDLVCPPD